MFRMIEAVKNLVSGRQRQIDAFEEDSEPEEAQASPTYHSRAQYESSDTEGQTWRRAYSSRS